MKSYFFILLALILAFAIPLRSEPLKKGEVGSDAINATIDALLVVATAAPVNAVAASQTLTASGVFSNGQTVTIGGVVYTFETTLTNVAGNVLIGANAAASLDNLKSAVNLTAGGGTTYAAATVIHPTVTATTNADTTQLFVAKTAGAGGNALTSTETCANAAFGAATFAGGVSGTLGQAKELRYYNGYLYFTPTRMTTATATWVKSAQFTAP
jgi:hypothetical protein